MRRESIDRRPVCLPIVCIAATAFVLLTNPPVRAQAPRTISHQGILTDPSGDPVGDATRSMTFGIYDVSSGGSALWTETKSVETVNGVFNTELGSSNPITGVNFNKDLWLGVKVGTDAEMTPRGKLTSVPSAFGLVMPFEDTLSVSTADLGTDGSEAYNEDITVHANDAMIGLYSNAAGAWGSGLQLGEIFGGVLRDKWAIVRKTNPSQSALVFTYGADPNYAVNPALVTFDTAGAVNADAFKYTEPRRFLYSMSSAEFDRVNDNYVGWDRYQGYPAADGPEFVVAPVHLPDDAVIKTFTCTVYDNAVSADLTCKLKGTGNDNSNGTDITSVSSSGTQGYHNFSTSLSYNVNNISYGYVVEVSGAFWNTQAGDLRLRRVTIEYEMSQAE